MITREEVYRLIDGERAYQEAEWGPQGRRRPPEQYGSNATAVHHSVGNWIVFLRHHLAKAEAALTTMPSDIHAMNEIRKVAALAVACIEQHNCPMRF